MSAAELLADLTQLGVEVVAHEDRLRFRPRSALTPGLVERLRTHKEELLAILRPTVFPDGATTALAAGEAETAESRPDAAPEVIRWEDCLDPPDPCAKCGSLELWQTLAGNWRCLRCDPPTTATRLLEQVQRIRRRHGVSR